MGGGGGGGLGASIGGLVGGFIGEGKASGDKSKAQGYAEDAMNALINTGIPPDLSKEIIYQKFKEAGILDPEMEQAIEQSYSKVAQQQEAPETRNAQMEALNAFKQLGATGLGAQDRAALNQIRDQVQRDQEGKRQQILQNMQARGMGGSGAELIAQLQGSQGAANLASSEGDKVAAMAQERALQALGQSAGLAGNIRSQDYTAATNRAQAEDEMNRFNVGSQQAVQQRNIHNRNVAQQQNLTQKQGAQDANVNVANKELLRQADAKRQKWLDDITRGQIQSQGYSGMANEYDTRARNIASTEQKRGTAIGGIAEKAAKAIMTMGGSEALGGMMGGGGDEGYQDMSGYAAFGGMVPGQSITRDNSFLNDLVNIKATPGEVILPNEVVNSEDPGEKAKEFVKALLRKKQEQPEEEIIDPRAIDQDAMMLAKSAPGNLGPDDPAAIDPNRAPAKDMGDVGPIDYKKNKATEDLENQIMFGKNDLSTVKSLKAAQKEREAQQDMADLMMYSAMLGESFSGIENKDLRQLAQNKREGSKNAVGDFEKQVEIQKKDPTSAVSQGYKQMLEKQMGVKLGGDVSAADIEPFLTAKMKSQMKQAFFQKGGVDASGNMLVFDPKTGEFKSSGMKAADQMFQVKDPLTGAVNLVGRRAPTEGGPVVKGTFGAPKEATGKEENTHDIYSTLDDKSRTKVDKTREDFLKDTSTDRDAVVASGGIKTMLAAGKEMNGDVLRAIQNQLARGNGEKGTMTEGDVQGFGGKADILSRLSRYASMNLVGEMTDSDRKFLSDLSDVMERRANDYINQQSKVYSDNITKVTGLEDSKARTLLGVEKAMTSNRNKPKGQKSAPSDDKVTVEKDGQQFRLPKSQLEQAIEQGYSEVK